MWAASRLREFMPVADLAYRLTGFKKFPPNTHIFASQHLLSTVALMLESFRERSAERIHVLGKCYSTHPDVFSYLRQRGFDVNPRSVHFDSHEAFDDGFDVSTQDVCARIRDLLEVNTNAGSRREDKPLVVIMDDGGMLLEKVNKMLLHTPALSDGARFMFGVEQTSSGWQRLQKYDNSGSLVLPVYNVARSFAKLKYESPLISHFTMPRVLSNITQTRNGQKGRSAVGVSSKALILGGGAIGMNIQAHLNETGVIEAKIFDPNLGKSSSINKNEGGQHGEDADAAEDTVTENSIFTSSTDLEPLLEESDIIIGASGKCSLHETKLPLLKDGALLLSVSSSDRELSAPSLRCNVSQTNDWNQRFRVPLVCDKSRSNGNERRTVNLAYSGFPLTFEDRCSNAGEPNEMQLTMGSSFFRQLVTFECRRSSLIHFMLACLCGATCVVHAHLCIQFVNVLCPSALLSIYLCL